MKAEIGKTQYKNIDALFFKTSRLTALFSPEYGGKMLSLYCNGTGRRLLEESIGAKYKIPHYDGVYIDAECSAFDDMFPTVDRFRCDRYPWEGTVYPDHGEVYALPWEYRISENTLEMAVYSARFGYRLTKRIQSEGDAIRIDYEAHNLGPFPFDYIYMAHCMLKAEEGAVLKLPFHDGAPATVIFSDNESLGNYGEKIVWPITNGFDLSRTLPEASRTGFKVFFDQKTSGNQCEYQYKDGTKLKCRFSSDTLPYFALWANYGAFKDMYNVAIEPSSGVLDRPDIARKHGKYSELGAYATDCWTLKFDVEI
jgi:hypothetical protein